MLYNCMACYCSLKPLPSSISGSSFFKKQLNKKLSILGEAMVKQRLLQMCTYGQRICGTYTYVSKKITNKNRKLQSFNPVIESWLDDLHLYVPLVKRQWLSVTKSCGVHWAVSVDHLGAVLSQSLLNSVSGVKHSNTCL